MSSKGNVLFLILIAVALFAALSYAVTSTSRGNGSSISKEKAEIAASELLQQATKIEQAVTKLTLFNKCADTDLSFFQAGTLYGGSYFKPDDAQDPPPDKCNVYHPDGGGVAIAPLPKAIGTLEDYTNNDFFALTYLPLRTYIKDVGVNYANSSDWDASTEIAITVQMQSKETCMAINDLVGVTNTGGIPPVNTGTANALSSSCEIEGVRTCSVINSTYGVAEIKGKRTGCFYQPNNSAHISSSRYTFFHVVSFK